MQKLVDDVKVGTSDRCALFMKRKHPVRDSARRWETRHLTHPSLMLWIIVLPLVVLCAGAASTVVEQVAADVHQRTGRTIVVHVGTVGQIEKKLAQGIPADVVIVSGKAMRILVKEGTPRSRNPSRSPGAVEWVWACEPALRALISRLRTH